MDSCNTDFSLAANIARFAPLASDCTGIITITYISTDTSATVGDITRTSLVPFTVTGYSTTVTVHVTPLRNGTTLTSTESRDVTTSVSFEKRATSDVAASFTYVLEGQTRNLLIYLRTSPYQNSSLAITPTLTKLPTFCSTVTSAITVTNIVTLPGTTGVTITLTSTMLTASTLFITDYPDPAVFEPTKTSTVNAIPTRPTEPGTTGAPIGEPSIPALPQDTSHGLPEPTASNPVQRSSRGPGLPPDALPTSPAKPPNTKMTSIAGEIRTTTLPGIGPVVIDPSLSAIFISGVGSAITPGQQTTINDIPISFDTSATFIVVDGTRTVGVPPSTPAPRPAPVVIGGTTIDVGQIATELDPGEVTTVNGVPISLDDAASNVVIGETKTIPLLEVTQMPAASMVVVGETTLDVGELASELVPGEVTVIGTVTVSRDSSAIVAGTTTISLPSSPSDVVVGGMTITAESLPSGYSFIPATAGGGLLLPNGQTLMPGAMTTISGVEISLTPAETPVVVVEGSVSITSTRTVGSTFEGFNNGGTLGIGQPTSTSTGGLTQLTGDAVAATRDPRNMLWVSAIVGMLFGIACSLI
ncbi:unnamed protein product [Alternaria burnsii]|nr:unnamed protein product [Alternaria burnsii]